MNKSEFQKITEKILFLDGATGSNLMAAGMPRGVCTEQWLLEHPDTLIDLQRRYVKAGSNVVYAPTFGANRSNLTMHQLENHIEEYNKKLVALSKTAVEDSAYVAGDFTTTGKMLSQNGEMTYEKAFDIYAEQITYLAEAGVDLLVAETMINIDETCAALDAASSVCDLPIMCSMTVDADGTIFSGGNIIEAAYMYQEAGASAVGINCSLGPDQMASVIANIRKAVHIPVIAKPNAGMPEINAQGVAVYNMSAQDFAHSMIRLYQNGASLLGGCCGTTPAYIHELTQMFH